MVMKAHRPFSSHADPVSRSRVDEGKVGGVGGQREQEEQPEEGALLSKKTYSKRQNFPPLKYIWREKHFKDTNSRF